MDTKQESQGHRIILQENNYVGQHIKLPISNFLANHDNASANSRSGK